MLLPIQIFQLTFTVFRMLAFPFSAYVLYTEAGLSYLVGGNDIFATSLMCLKGLVARSNINLLHSASQP